ncbi:MULTISPECIES: lipopolysaccharide biosynthesis protein [Pseudomonas syringae group]|uniref:lipopolysaccharide biosynthesis protein n=1 Tax=Pseudomonas syringae group TaxID=136849 RepID=UPI0006D5FCA2|nr:MULTISPECIES: oligosaccharide flippase family protein [Pseudomonas syringae group]KPZ24407.1 Polysaccharide biosynthesis protein [Pseudomonas coronafaciens pv. zizaniae]MCF5805018.1 oligosaccharide flippase family protein [Pseudomonas tremae]MCF5811132.1 oligosaccharide flippase family protein [Pseudomonas tremae]RMN33775.1 Polysaccharide biosynthesis protein [Pseudomonas coronafaciens pv. zizaniae]
MTHGPSSLHVSIFRNTLLNYGGQAYVLLIGILIMPFYLNHLGAEAYGLIGFFTLLQAWLQLLDAGLSPSLVRAVAHQRGIPALEQKLGLLLRSFELLFLPLAVLSGLLIVAASTWIATRWLNADTLQPDTLSYCIGLMGLIIALRLYSTLYKSGLQGLEQHGWLNAANVSIATLRYLGGLLLVSQFSQDPRHFFEFQAAVGLIEALVFACKAWHQMPAPRWLSGLDWPLVKPILPFAGSLSLSAVLWVVLTQMDKALLSNVLPLDQYGYFSLVALITTGILMLANPLIQTLLPRMTVLMAEGKRDDMHALFLGANRMACSVLFPLAAVIALHAEPLIFAWSGDEMAARWSRPVLGWYALGSAIMAASAFQFYLQYAYGRMQLHLWYSLVSTAITVPVMCLAIHYQGVYGAALAWFFLRMTSFAIWPLIVHQCLAPGIHRQWLSDIVRITIMTAVGLAISEPVFRLIAGQSRGSLLLAMAVSGLITLALVAGSHRPLRSKIHVLFSKPST